MLEDLRNIDWDIYREMLWGDDVPVLLHLLVFNGLLVLIRIARWAFNAKPMGRSTRKSLVFLWIVANGLLLFQRELGIEEYVAMLDPRTYL